MTEDLLWPDYAGPDDLAAIEAVPLEARGLPVSTYALLARAATTWPNRTAISVLPEAARWHEPVHRTFAELLADVHRYANLFHGLGVRRTDAVALMSPNCAELVPATLAAQLAGIAAPLNGNLSRQHLTELVRRSGARVLVTAGPELSPSTWACAHALAVAGMLDAVLVLRPTGASGAPEPLPVIEGVRVGYLGELAAGMAPSTFDGEPPGSSDLAAFFHTGGTTGAPKLAAHTHANEVADAWMLAANSLLDQESVIFAALPLFHVNALVVTVLNPLLKGQETVWAGPLGYREPALYGEFWKIVEHYRIATMSAVPTVYAVLAGCPVDADISSLRFAMVGASPLPAAVRDSFQTRTGITLVEGYGLTEATCASARTLEDTLLAHPQVTGAGAVGRPDIHAGEVPVAYVTLAPGTVVTEQELCDWARERVPDRAAAPRTVTILDALPVTDVGKPYKLALRADAASRELAEALVGITGVSGLDVEIEDGSVVAAVTIDPSADETAVKAVLGHYAIGWRVAVTACATS